MLEMASDINSDSSGSDSGSTPEEERIRRLFQTCDGNGDGYIDSQDLLAVCKQLNLEHCVEEIMEQLGADENGRISYSEFLRRRMQLINEINALTLHEQSHREHMSTAHDSRDSYSHPVQQASPAPGSTSTGNWPTSSDSQGSQGASGKHESWEFDSGARDLSPEPNTLHKLIEAAGGTITGSSNDLLELANKLHLAALASLKGEIMELTNRLHHAAQERDILERQLKSERLERLRFAHGEEERLEQQALRYEERLTELHSIIAELSKKLDAQRASVIKEEDECSQQSGDESQSRISESQSQCTSTDNNAVESCSDKGFPIESEFCNELSRTSVQEMKKDNSSVFSDNKCLEERETQNGRTFEDNTGLSENQIASYSLQITQLHGQILILKAENTALQEQLDQQEMELSRVNSLLSSCCEERDRLQKKVREIQTKLASLQSQSSQGSQTGSSPTRSKSPHINPTTGERTPTSREDVPIAKMAERIRLKKTDDRHILGPEISSLGLSSSKVAEHLVHNVQEDSHSQEIFQILFSSGSSVPESKIREFEVEMERLNSKIEHLKSQNDLLNLTLEESKSQCDRLSVLLGKHESNNTALQLALSYSDQAIETFEVLLALLETEQSQILANCRAAGLGSSASDSMDDDQEEVTSILKRSHDNRKAAENVAKHFLQKLERSFAITSHAAAASNVHPWEDSSYHTASSRSSTSSSGESDFCKLDEQRLRDYIMQLKSDLATVRTTVVELESIHLDPVDKDPISLMDAQKLDLENAVLMQELMAIKEEKAELKAQVYLLEKEKTSLELQLSTREAQEQAYLVQIEHLKNEIQDQSEVIDRLKKSESNSEVSDELSDSSKRESKLKARIQDLMSTVEKVTKNSELRAQQSVDFVNGLKRTNSALVIAFEKSKKKQQTKIKKLEQQMSSMIDRHNAQVRMLKQRIAMLEGDTGHHLLQPLSVDTP